MADNPSPKESIEEVIRGLPKKEQVIMTKLRSLILECLPKATEKNSYGVPFYTHHRMICFLWPPSVRWGPKDAWNDKGDKGVVLGFCQGNRMSNEDGLLLAEGRKQVYCMYFQSLPEIKEDLIRALLFEAELIDDDFGKQKKNKKVTKKKAAKK